MGLRPVGGNMVVQAFEIGGVAGLTRRGHRHHTGIQRFLQALARQHVAAKIDAEAEHAAHDNGTERENHRRRAAGVGPQALNVLSQRD